MNIREFQGVGFVMAFLFFIFGILEEIEVVW